jgi:hypothetical protein
MKKMIFAFMILGAQNLCGCATNTTKSDNENIQTISANGIDLKGFFAEVDKNNDKCISDDEWFGVGLPKSAHGMLSKNGCVTMKSLIDVGPPADIDLNKDGKLTLKEFLEFDGKGPPPKSNQ